MFLWNIAVTAGFIAAFSALTLQWLVSCGASLPASCFAPPPVRQGVLPARSELTKVFLAALAFRLLFALASLLIYNILSQQSLSLSDLPELWLRWDARHYVKLVEQGYAASLEDGKPIFLVFFPLYVWLTRAVTLILPDTALAGLMVSAVCFAGGCVYFYRLGCMEYGRTTTRTALLLLAAYPFSFFFGGVMTESLFFLTTAAALWHIRQHEWGKFALWGALAALTRMMGLILIGAAVAELGTWIQPFSAKGKERKLRWFAIGKRLPLLLVPVLGSGVYLALNASVTGNPFAFTQMQAHWYQGFQWFPSVLVYLAKNAVTWPNVSSRWEMWIPELILFFLFAVLLWRHWRKHRSMLMLYAFVYLILNYCLSWLMSAGRYLSCNLPCFLFAAVGREEQPIRTSALICVMVALQILFLYRYFCWGQVM